RSILLTGDAQKDAEEAMVASGLPLRSDVLKVGHHGSRTSSSEAFLDAVRPEAAVACLGRKNRFGFPHPEVVARYLARGIPLWRTDGGAVAVETDGDSLSIRRAPPRAFLPELLPF